MDSDILLLPDSDSVQNTSQLDQIASAMLDISKDQEKVSETATATTETRSTSPSEQKTENGNEETIQLDITESKDPKWQKLYEELSAYKTQHNHFLVPPESSKELYNWMQDQRHANQDGTISKEHKYLLEKIGFTWAVLKKRKIPIKTEDLVPVSPKSRPAGSPKIPKEKKPSSPKTPLHPRMKIKITIKPPSPSSPEPIEIEIPSNRPKKKTIPTDIVESPISPTKTPKSDTAFSKEELQAQRDEKWNRRFAELKAFKEKHGHFMVPARSPETKTMHNWLHNQRTCYKLKTLPKDRIVLLNEIGFPWAPGTDSEQNQSLKDKNENWRRKFEELKQYAEEAGNFSLSTKTHKSLFYWVQNQRSLYNRGELLSDREELLNSIGFVWNPRRKSKRRKSNGSPKERSTRSKKRSKKSASSSEEEDQISSDSEDDSGSFSD